MPTSNSTDRHKVRQVQSRLGEYYLPFCDRLTDELAIDPDLNPSQLLTIMVAWALETMPYGYHYDPDIRAERRISK